MIPEILNIPVPLSVMEKAPVEFDKTILKNANSELQNTTSDKSFLTPKAKPNTAMLSRNEDMETEIKPT